MTTIIQGLQDLLKQEFQAALLGDGVVLQLDTASGQEDLTFKGSQSGETLTATASFAGLSTPTFSGLRQIVKKTTLSALTTARPTVTLSSDFSGLKVSIDTNSRTLTAIELDVDPHLSRLLGDPSLPDSLALSGANLSLTIDPKKKSYTFACDISAGDGGWTLVKGFSLDGLTLEVAGTPSASPALTLGAQVSIGGAAFQLEAERAADSVTKGGGGSEDDEAPPAPAWKFSGQLEKGAVSVSGLLGDIQSELGVTLPSFIASASLDALTLAFDTGTKDFSFTSDSDATGSIDLEIGAAEGSVVFTYHGPKGADIDIQGLVSAVSPELGSLVPAMKFAVTDAVFVRTGGDSARLLFGIDIGGGIDLSSLSGLPIVGSKLAGDKTVKLSYQILAASDAFTADEAKALQKQLGDKYTTLPATIDKGVDVHASLKLGEQTQDAELPVSIRGDQVQADSSKSDVHWFKLQKAFGPVHLDQVGVAYKAGDMELLLRASVELGGLSISLDGLGISSPLSPLSPTFHLDGMGIDYQMDPLEIGGAFRRQENAQGVVEYDGAAVLQMGFGDDKLGLHAIGSYADDKGDPSLFLYAYVDVPMGGPPFLFVEGLAAGFGYNRSLTVPDLDKFSDFPLVAEAVQAAKGGPGPDTTTVANVADTLTGELDKLDTYVDFAVGAGFLAVGLKFSSFKMIDSFALITAELGDRFELDLIGVSDLLVPCEVDGVDPLAALRMDQKASFVPADGVFGRVAALDKSSYILSKQCTLSGGFACYTWFGGQHAGDFVVTLGGYHPTFKVPSHYPNVPRLGFNWRVDGSAVIKGEAYFALCAHALMAGGSLDASYHAGKVHASFTVGADFLISWQPYHYDIDARASFSAGIGALSAHLGADLHIWGPDFGGKAKIKIVVVKVTIKFGDQGSTDPAPIGWSAFQSSFVPDASKVCGITVQGGLVRQLKATVGDAQEDLYVVNPKHFVLATDSFFPSNAALVGTEPPPGVAYTPVGVRPMGVSAGVFSSQHKITITRCVDSSWVSDESAFTVTPLQRPAPSAIWGDPVVKDNQLQPPGPNEPRFVAADGQEPVSGFRITPAAQPQPGHTIDVPKSELQYDTDVQADYYGWQTLSLFHPSTSDDAARRATLRETVATNTRRDAILTALGYSPAEDVQIDPIALDASLVVAPQVA